MVVRLIHDVFCDECGDWEHAFVDTNVNRNKARKAVKAKGWGRLYGKDYCPKCWKERENEGLY